jgi:death-on-curing protein
MLSAIARPFATIEGKLTYSSGLEQAAALSGSLVGNHPFVDGNKRTGMLATLFFLESCGYWRDVALLSSHEIDQLKDLTLGIARGDIKGPPIARELYRILRPSRNRSIHTARLLSSEFK